MFSLKRLFGKQDKFFDLLEASAQQTVRSVQALVELFNKPPAERSLDDFIQTRRKEKHINEEISMELCKTFVTPLEREDIEALSGTLYKIPKTVEKFGEHFLLCQDKILMANFSKQVKMLAQAAETILQMVKCLRQKPKLENMREHNERLQYLEGEADKLVLELLRDLYSGRYEALQVVILRHLYELLEKVIDRCRDAGNVIFHIVLKNS